MVVFFCLHTDKNIAVLSQLVFFALILTNIWQFCPSVLLTQSIHIFGLVYYLSTSRNSPFYIRYYTYGKRLFVLFQVNVYKNGKIVVLNILFDFIQIFTFVKHIFGLVYYLSIYIRCYTYGKRSFVLFQVIS